MALENDTQAPDFDLANQYGEHVRLSDFRGVRPVALVFFPLAFSSTCTGELCALRDDLSAFQNDDVQLLAVSCDPVFTLKAWAADQGFEFPLLSDFWPHGAVSTAYGVFDVEKGAPRRSSYVIDKAGTVRWSVHNAMPEGRDLDEHLKQLHSLA